MSKRTFIYANYGGDVPVNDLPFAALDMETTGIEPSYKHYPIEISVVLFKADGTREQSFTTLINPGIPIDNVPFHGITDQDVEGAPIMNDILPYLISLLNERVLVAHNAPFEERFLFHAAQRCGISLKPLCAVDTLSLARACLDLPNHKLATICDYLGIKAEAWHRAEADALATGFLYLNLRKRRILHLPQFPSARQIGEVSRPRTKVRVPKLVKGTEGYMSNLLKQLPISSVPVDGLNDSAYRDMLSAALADSRLEKQEAQSLGKLAMEMGLSSQRVAELHASFLDAALTIAKEDSRIDTEELRNLKQLAKLVGQPGYFDELKAERKTRGTMSVEL